MARKAPCECGHPYSWHNYGKGWCTWPVGQLFDDCLVYVPAKRTEPLRARRQWAPSDRRVEIHLHFDGPVTLTKHRLAGMLSDIRRQGLV